MQDSVFDKCMYCGEPIKEIFQLSEIKKERLREDQEKRVEEGKKTSKKFKNYSRGTEGGCGGGCGSCGG